MLRISELFIYPIKSLGGIRLSSSPVTDRGLQYDRRWMLVDEHHQFLTQRNFPDMALLQVEVRSAGLQVRHRINGATFFVPFEPQTAEKVRVQVWSDRCSGRAVSKEADAWFSEMLSLPCRLVYMPDDSKRRVDTRYAHNREITSFSDAYPFLLIGQASLDDLNSKLQESLPMNRFRPNLVVTGGEPFEEDGWEQFTINNMQFLGVKRCARCVVTTINQENAVKGKEPLKTLATYRMRNNKIYFGQNLLHQGTGTIKVGDAIDVQKRKGT